MDQNTLRRLNYYIDNSADFFALHVSMAKKTAYNLRQQAEVENLRRKYGNAFTAIIPKEDMKQLVKTHLHLFSEGSDSVARWTGTYPLEMLELAKAFRWLLLWHGDDWKKRPNDRPTHHENDITARLNAVGFNGETYIRTGNIHKKGNGYNPDITGNNGTTIECKGLEGRMTVKALPQDET